MRLPYFCIFAKSVDDIEHCFAIMRGMKLNQGNLLAHSEQTLSLLKYAGWLACSLALHLNAQNFAGDMALSKVLIEGENWHRVGSGFGFTDGACTDESGRFYFSGRQDGKNSIFRINQYDEIEVFIEDAPGVSGLAFGPDGRLFGCRWGKNDVFVFDENKQIKILSTDTHANDLVISQKGEIFYTSENGVQFLDAYGKKSRITDAVSGPNGICFSPDMGVLTVSEYTGDKVWAFAVVPGKGATHGDTYMTMRSPSDGTDCCSDGMTVDTEGRYYVTTAIGLQMFDATGRISGVIAKPSKAGMSNVAFSGPGRHFLYATCGDAIFKRKTKAKGVWHYKTH